MNSSADLTITGTDQFLDNLGRVRDEVLYNINATIAGNLDVNLTAELNRFFTEGLSVFYYNASFESTSSVFIPDDEERACAIDDIYMHFFPPTEQREIASLGNRLQQIKAAYDLARNVSTVCMLVRSHKSGNGALALYHNFVCLFCSFCCTHVMLRISTCTILLIHIHRMDALLYI